MCPKCSSPAAISNHSSECAAFLSVPSHLRQGDTDYLRWFLRYFALRRRHPSAPCPFSNLVNLEPLHDPATVSWSAGFASLFQQHANPPPAIAPPDIKKLLLCLRVNDLGFPYTKDHNLGWSLDSKVCLMNHSCEPSCAVSLGEGGVLEVRALRDIHPGDALTISYLDLASEEHQSVAARRAALQEKYLFSCGCARCEREAAAAPESEAGTQVKVVVPPGAGPGNVLSVVVNGKQVQVRVPEGAGPGTALVITV
ncbi:hypothetical protein TeGR_g11057 [Tetraparma gracilis]|uniref:SET domain-containing protein n=1 Tax=Tetraparma gracilis TaxID=2962635 RepID=A0ABQ6MC75_9STRA|nr:hypothetical protein TeGR_g11057 [Tetraparma gracilis]